MSAKASRKGDRRCNGKRRYRGPEEAKRAVRTIKTKGRKRAKTPGRVYRCPYCQGYHLTSQTT